ncbi:(Fe-S)-binding protein [Candidatus Chlorohelix sp.]|uniref:(Fe-S)-binding protein n=1 Tax=Candidatus Chlorohelix sp. TaxID=3139201 RepID=UPI00302A1E00
MNAPNESWIGRIIFVLLAGAAIYFFVARVIKLVNVLKQGQNENRFDQPGKRIWLFVKGVLLQERLWRRFLPGLAHTLTFWGFLIIQLGLIEFIFQGLTGIAIPLLDSRPFAILLDTFLALVIVSLVYFAIRRAFVKPKVLTTTTDAWIILSLIAGVVLTLLFAEAFAWRANPITEHGYTPIGRRLGELLIPSSGDWPTPNEATQSVRDFAGILWSVAWWAHMAVFFSFLAYLPSSKHLHLLGSFFTTYFQNLGAKGKLRSYGNTDELEKRMEEEKPIGASKIEEFTWRDLLDTYSCTECGRCTSVCPANLTGKPLNPKKIIIDLKTELFMQSGLGFVGHKMPSEETAGAADSGSDSGKSGHAELPPLVGGLTTHEELWACTTCRACMTECPVFIEHVPKIVEMRRYLVIQESDFPKEVTPVFNNLERNSNPWQINNKERADWLKSLPEHLQHRQMAEIDEDEGIEVLFWVGCMGSFDNRNKKISVNLALLMDEAGIKWGILGKEESCTGDAARRMGNEYLFATLAQQNIEILNAYKESHKFKKIVTGCPHCFNTIKNEYPEFGGNFEVVHHSKLVAQLIEEGRIKAGAGLDTAKVTYHDPCYLGRYNDIYDAPRYALNSLGNGVKKLEITEMPRSRDKSFCCGAGGGQAWMEEKIGTRVNQTRVQEAADTGAEVVAASCPFCISMFEDGIKGRQLEEKLKVQDITELVMLSKNKKALPMAKSE